MAKLDAFLGFVIGYCISDCIEKDYALKPVFCTLACGIASIFTVKVTVESAGAVYDGVIKPTLKALVQAKVKKI